MDKKLVYREYFPGYMGHIPLKNDVIGLTVGATNDHIKKTLTKEPPHQEQLVPAPEGDYNYYHKNYFNDNFSKEYQLEEDQIYSNISKNSKTWIGGNKFKIYPQHIPGLTSHIPGIKSSNLFGMSYAKSTSVAIKEIITKEEMSLKKKDIQVLITITLKNQKKLFLKSKNDTTTNVNTLKETGSKTINSGNNGFTNCTNFNQFVNQENLNNTNDSDKFKESQRTDLCQSFKDILHLEKKTCGATFLYCWL